MPYTLSFTSWLEENHSQLVKQFCKAQGKKSLNNKEWLDWLKKQYTKETGQLP